jgi:hypothetical protein
MKDLGLHRPGHANAMDRTWTRDLSDDQLLEKLKELANLPSARNAVEREIERRGLKS